MLPNLGRFSRLRAPSPCFAVSRLRAASVNFSGVSGKTNVQTRVDDYLRSKHGGSFIANFIRSFLTPFKESDMVEFGRWRKIQASSRLDPRMYASVHAFVVKIIFASTEIEPSQPWMFKKEVLSSGSGFSVSRKWILTNAAHVRNLDSTFVYVQKATSISKYKAKVYKMAQECELALLTVEDKDFREDLVPLELAELPAQHDVATVASYPLDDEKGDGDKICFPLTIPSTKI